jgi:hypothetical protein
MERKSNSRIRKKVQKSNIYVERMNMTPSDDENRIDPDSDGYVSYEDKVQQSLTYQVLEEMWEKHMAGEDISEYPAVLHDL